MSKRAYAGLVILALSVGLFISYRVLTPTWHVPLQLKYDVLKDTLTITLTVVAVGIAVIGYAIYLIVLGQLQTKTAMTVRTETTKGAIRLFIHDGFIFWENYDKAVDKDPNYLEIAIAHTERALEFHNQLPSGETEDRATRLSFCLIRNNLAYYFALRKRPEDRDLAMEYAEYVRKQASNFPGERANWIETYQFVKREYPD